METQWAVTTATATNINTAAAATTTADAAAAATTTTATLYRPLDYGIVFLQVTVSVSKRYATSIFKAATTISLNSHSRENFESISTFLHSAFHMQYEDTWPGLRCFTSNLHHT